MSQFKIFTKHHKGKDGLDFLKYVSYVFAVLKGQVKNNGIMILLSALLLPIRVCEVFNSVIVIHPSSVHSELITAYEK